VTIFSRECSQLFCHVFLLAAYSPIWNQSPRSRLTRLSPIKWILTESISGNPTATELAVFSRRLQGRFVKTFSDMER
jgi:hypothetical protein